MAVITESWLRDSEVEGLEQELLLGAGLGLLVRNRDPNDNGVSYGGVALLWRVSRGNFKRLDIKNTEGYEVLAAAGSVKGQARKLIVIACYLPPSYTKPRGAGALEFVEKIVLDMKRTYNDPYIIVTGDFNQWRMAAVLDNFPDISEVPVGNTRGNRSIDKVFCNMGRSVKEAGTVLPLEAEDEEGNLRRSDHRVVFCRFDLKRQKNYSWEVFTYRRCNDELVKKFKEWLVFHDWAEVKNNHTSDEKAEAYQRTVVDAMNEFFPERTVRRKSTDPPWMDKRTLDLIEDRRRLYVEEGGRTGNWKEKKEETRQAVKKRKREFFDKQKDTLLANDLIGISIDMSRILERQKGRNYLM